MKPLAFVDLETTGSNSSIDRITEIGIVLVDLDGSVQEWQQLVNPGVQIPPFIEQLTGINNEMVKGAPPFSAVADKVYSLLKGRLFIAHNASFDNGFLKCEFKRLSITFRAPVLCTVKLSRALFPEHKRHNLDSLIERHALQADARHRALADAQLIHQFWQKIHVDRNTWDIAAALQAQNTNPTLPAHLDASLIDDLPESAGVYLFYGEQNQPLHISRAKDIRTQVLAHFNGKKSGKNAALASQVQRIDWLETAGEIGAALKEAALIKQLLPGRKDQMRNIDAAYSWPFSGPVLLREGDETHLIDSWRYLGTARDEAALYDLLENKPAPFDHNIYRILTKYAGKMIQLSSSRF